MKYNFVILSNQQYDFELKTNKWHVAKRLSAQGHKVVFVDPPLRFKAFKTFVKNPSFDLRKLFFNTEKKNENLIIYRPANVFNFWPFSEVNTYLHASKINELSRDFFHKEAKTILYIYHFDFPDLENFVKKITHDLMIYDCVDEYTAFPEYAEGKKVNPSLIAPIQKIDDLLKIYTKQKGISNKNWVYYREEWLCKNSDLVFASAPELVAKLSKWKTPIYYLPNAAESKLFDMKGVKVEDPEYMKKIPHPRIGFSGAIDTYKNDIHLIEMCAETYPQYNFVLLGPEKIADPDLDLTKLKAMQNVFFVGKKPWEDTPVYFNVCDVFFIPYNLNLVGCFPVKYFEALAVGLPTVITALPGLEEFDVDGFVSKTREDFVKNIKKAVEENSPAKIAKRKKMAYENTWDGKVEKQLKLIEDYTSSERSESRSL